MVLILDGLGDEDSQDSEKSVPLRGLWFLSNYLTVVPSPSMYKSVPLRGLWFLSKRG